MDSVLNSFNKNTRANVYGGKKKQGQWSFPGCMFLENKGKNFKLNLVQVLVLVL